MPRRSLSADPIAFIESKAPDMARIATLLEICRERNYWANRGPLYHRLAEDYSAHFRIGPDRRVTPCANGGIALEAIARLLAMRAGRKHRWVASAFSFANLGRGYFADIQFVDCDSTGMLDLDEVRALDPGTFDGLVVVNPFGLARDFSAYAAFARETGKEMIIDNAAGIDSRIPDWPWQSFSLHHTKPYGAGEGGLGLTPADSADELYALIGYGAAPSDPAAWLNNGKISDIACAFQIDRLERNDEWAPLYQTQSERVTRIAIGAGLSPLQPTEDAPPAMSRPFLSKGEVPYERLKASRRLTFAKYYKPLADLPNSTELYARLVNIPTHPDMARIDDGTLAKEIMRHVLGTEPVTGTVARAGPPFFIIGNPRSGTSLLRLMLNANPEIAVPPECGFNMWLYDSYVSLNLKDAAVVSRYVRDVFASRKFETWGLPAEVLERRVASKGYDSYPQIAAEVYAAYAIFHGKRPKLLGDKNNHYITCVERIMSAYSDSKFIHVVRDGRDVACSYLDIGKRNIDSEYKPNLSDDVATIAAEWKKNCERMDGLSCERTITLRYEDLLEDPVRELQRLCIFLGARFDPAMLNYFRKNDEPSEFFQWKEKTFEPIDRSSAGKFRARLSPQEITVFEEIAGNTLARFGYRLETRVA